MAQSSLRRGIGDMSIPADEKERRKKELTETFEIEQFFRERFRFAPLPDEARIMLRIEETADKLATEMFAEADQALSHFYESVRIPEIEVVDGQRVTKIDDGRIVWQTDELGRVIEDWDRLEGIELEGTILTLQRVILRVTDEVSRLYGRALVADKVRDDEYQELYRKPIEGTKDDRNAYAVTKTREARWFYYGTYLVYVRLRDKLEVLKETKKSLEFFRSRQMKAEAEG